MPEDTFAKALRNFTMDAACGDAIRMLADKGYTPSQIRETLTFPAPAGYIAKVMWEHFVNTHRILLSDPAEATVNTGEIYETIERRDSYGRRSFLRVKKESPEELIFSPEDYIVCDYGRRLRNGEVFENELITALPWPLKKVWGLASLFSE
jgi:hypothetical protein